MKKLTLLVTATMMALCSPLLADDYTGWQTKHSDWQLVFGDEFSGSSLDSTKWNRIDYTKDKVSDWRVYQSRDEELVTMNGDGTVSLWGKKGKFTSQADQTGENETYACGGIFTDKTFTFQYGYVEVRAKFDCADGAWPAIWMMPTSGPWPQTGEIDIMEHLNHDGIIYQTVHYNNANGEHVSDSTAKGGVSTAYFTTVEEKLAFHTYGVEWTPESVIFFKDGKKTHTHLPEENNPNWPFNKEGNPYYLLLDMQVGGDGEKDWVGSIVNIGNGVAMTVDYVRVYSTPNVPEPATATLSLLALCGLAARRRRK